MTKINTTKIGDQFESKSLEILKRVIEEEQLGSLSKHLRIFSKKGYYSHIRKSDIIFDLTIEVWPPNATRYALIYIVECKDYSTRVPVNKIEDFHSKIQQVAGVNVKGIFISNSPLQKAGYSYAESVGMMVIQGESFDDYKIVLHKINRDSELTGIPYIKGTSDINLIDKGLELVEKLIDKKILSILNKNISKVSYGIDRLSKTDIEQLAETELNKINPLILSQAYTLNPRLLTDYLIKQYDIIIITHELEDILGSCDIENNTIGLNKSIVGTRRELFVLAHEFGHFILHQKLSIDQMAYDAFEDAEFNFRKDSYELTNPKHWIEWQANYFASSLVLPKVIFLARVTISQSKLNMHIGKIYLDDQPQNIKDFNELVRRLSYVFNVTKTTVIYKLKEMDRIKDNSRLKKIGQIISEYIEELCI